MRNIPHSPEMKVCSKCNTLKDLSMFFLRADYKNRYRSQCKECCAKAGKESSKRWSKKHYEKLTPEQKAIKYAKVRKKYSEDADYRANLLRKIAEKHRQNRKKYCVVCTALLPPHSIKYCDKCREIESKKRKTEYIQGIGRERINELQKIRVKKKIAELTDGYIVMQIRTSKYPGLKKKDIPAELINLKRASIQFKRELKTIKK